MVSPECSKEQYFLEVSQCFHFVNIKYTNIKFTIIDIAKTKDKKIHFVKRTFLSRNKFVFLSAVACLVVASVTHWQDDSPTHQNSILQQNI